MNIVDRALHLYLLPLSLYLTILASFLRIAHLYHNSEKKSTARCKLAIVRGKKVAITFLFLIQWQNRASIVSCSCKHFSTKQNGFPGILDLTFLKAQFKHFKDFV